MRSTSDSSAGTGEKCLAVLIPCYNEETTITEVIQGFRRELPDSKIYVYDNDSDDRTAERALDAGAVVVRENRRGKGNVVRSMFRQVEADIYVIVDGDLTYPPGEVEKLIQPVADDEADMSVGDRISSQSYGAQNKRRFHGFGNRLVPWLINRLFKSELKDIMTGYRVFNRFFVKTFPVMSKGFEIETEMTLHALDRKFRIREVPISYKDRPDDSVSKLNTYSDGMRILKTIASLFKDYYPLSFFGYCATFCALLGLAVGAMPIFEYIQYSYVYRVPSAILAAAIELLAVVLLTCGLILNTVVRHHSENYELYLSDFWARNR